jgi:3-phytase
VPALAELDHRFRRYRLAREGDAWKATLLQTFGDVTPAGAIRIAESVFADPANDRLMLAEEDTAVGTRLRSTGWPMANIAVATSAPACTRRRPKASR